MVVVGAVGVVGSGLSADLEVWMVFWRVKTICFASLLAKVTAALAQFFAG